MVLVALVATLVLDPSCAWDPDIDKIATQALLRLPKEKREYGGVLYKNATGEYCYSTFAPGERDTFAFKAKIPKDTSLAGVYHNHPGDGMRTGKLETTAGDPRKHSDHDAEVAMNLKVPSYIRVDKDNGAIRRLAPGKRSNILIGGTDGV